jgi:DNA-binding Lrp family transcriptional regulator
MVKSPLFLSEYEKLILLSLLEDGRKTDTQVSDETKISKTHVNRIRRMLEKEGFISRYVPMIDLEKVGVGLFAVVLFQWKGYDNAKLTEQMVVDLGTDPDVAFFATGEGGSGSTMVLFLGFSDISEAHGYLNNFRKKYNKELGEILSFFIPSKGVIKQDYSEMLKKRVKNSENKGQ